MKRAFGFVVLVVGAAGVAAAQDFAARAAAAPADEAFAIGAAPAIIVQTAPVPPTPAVPPAPAAPAIIAQAAPVPPTPPVPPAPPVLPSDWYAWGKGSWLGIGVQEVDDERAKELKLPEARGVEVTTVAGDSPASKAGIKVNDVVTEYNGERVEGVEQFVRMVRETPPGRRVKLTVNRGGASQTLTATVGDRKQSFAGFQRDMRKMNEELGRQFGPDSKFQRDMQKLQQELGRMRVDVDDLPQGPMGWKNRALGVEAEPVGEQLAEFFGVKEGVLVRSVVKDSPAEKAGVKAGDVITRIGDTSVARPGDISRTVRQAAPGKALPLTVVRNKQQMTLNVTVEPRSSGEAAPRPPRPPRPTRNFIAPPVHGRLVAIPQNTL
ncbi:MAG: PDZ domain-containing protein [Acidobacteriota bacterium]